MPVFAAAALDLNELFPFWDFVCVLSLSLSSSVLSLSLPFFSLSVSHHFLSLGWYVEIMHICLCRI